MVRHAALTDAGRKRKNNEDSHFVAGELGVFVVADGVGGHDAGEVASAMTVQCFSEHAAELAEAVNAYTEHRGSASRNRVLERLSEVIQQASRLVYEDAEGRGRQGMATTVVALVVGGGTAFLAHVGDSRIYLVRDGELKQLTEDHSLVNEMVADGELTREMAAVSRYKNIITRSVGGMPAVQVDTSSIDILPDDRFVLCSDGLSDMVDDTDIGDLAAQSDVSTAVADLVNAALEAGGKDNVTVVLVEPEPTLEAMAARARARVLESLFLFRGFPFATRMRVSRMCEERYFGPGEALVRQDTEGDALYAIVEGEVSVQRNGTQLAQLGPGDHFGELGLLDSQLRSASVVGVTGGSALVVRRDEFDAFCQRDPRLGLQLTRRLMIALARRLRDANALASGR